MSTVRKLFSVNGVILVTLGIGFLNNLAIAAFFGLDRKVDSFFAGQLLPSMFMYLIMDYLGKNFLPIYAKRLHESAESASAIASTVINVVVLLSLLAVVILWISAEAIYGLLLPGFTAAEVVVVRDMFHIMAPAMVLMSLDQIHGYIWQHDERYTRVVLARLFVPLTTLGFIAGLRSVLGVYALPAGFLAGHVLSSLVLIVGAPYRYQLRLDLGDQDARTILRNSAMLTGTGVIARSREMITQFFASMLGDGAISAIAIARKLCTPFSEGAMVGVRMIIFARSAKQVARREHGRLGALYNFAITAVLLGLIPIAVWFLLDARLVVDVLFLRGAFTDTMAVLVATTLAGLSIAVPFMGINQILSNAFYALGKVNVPMILMPLGTLVYLVAAWQLNARFGLAGLASATSVWAATQGIALLLLLARELDTFSRRFVMVALARYSICAATAVLLTQRAREALGLEGWVGLAITVTSVAAVYLPLVWISKDATSRELVSHIRNGLSRTPA